jgi:hypothetical protein
MVASESRRARTRPSQVALHQGHAGALHGDVGAGAHGDADIGGGERGRVVDAVAGHGDDAALGSDSGRRRPLSSGSTSASTSSMPSRAGDRLGRRAVVAGQHDDADALGAFSAEIAAGVVCLHRIGDGENAGGPPSTATKIAVAPSARRASLWRVERCRVDRRTPPGCGLLPITAGGRRRCR